MNKVLLLGTLCSGWLAVAAENALTVRVLPTRGGPQVHVDGKPIAPRFFWGANSTWINIGGPPGPFLSQVALARDAGVNLVSFSAPECWSPPERPVDDAMLRRSRPFTPDVAMITDENSMCHLTGDSAVAAQPLTYSGRADFGRMGAPYGQYLFADVLAGKVPAKLQVFLSAWALSRRDQKRLGPRTPMGQSPWPYDDTAAAEVRPRLRHRRAERRSSIQDGTFSSGLRG